MFISFISMMHGQTNTKVKIRVEFKFISNMISVFQLSTINFFVKDRTLSIAG